MLFSLIHKIKYRVLSTDFNKNRELVIEHGCYYKITITQIFQVPFKCIYALLYFNSTRLTVVNDKHIVTRLLLFIAYCNPRLYSYCLDKNIIFIIVK